MRRHPTHIASLILVITFLLMTVTANAQRFKRPLSSGPSIKSGDARWNIGLVAGPNYSYWYHVLHPNADLWHLKDYKPEFRIGYFGGLCAEYMINNRFSLGVNAIYAQHEVRQSYVDEHFPYQWNAAQQSIIYSQRTHDLEASYQSVEVFLPFTYYQTLRLNKKIKPYIYVAPRASYILDGSTRYGKSDLLPDTTIMAVTHKPDTVAFADTLRFNYGATLGIGSFFKIETDSYYFILKIDVSVNVNLRQTYSQLDLLNEFNFKRYFTDAYVSITFMLPMKKRLRDACYYLQ